MAYPEIKLPTRPFTPCEAAERLVAGYTDGPRIVHTESQARYRPEDDEIRIARPERFLSAEEYYATLFHELGHSTGHSSRLYRGLDTKPAAFGSPTYAKEELVAEFAAAGLCGLTGIAPTTIDNAAAYIQGWLKALKSDKRLAVHAAGAGQKAVDWIAGERHR
ncbi:MAG: zincin-like metallopeptidase domain-containing protein [Planctomycetota bacterium]